MDSIFRPHVTHKLAGWSLNSDFEQDVRTAVVGRLYILILLRHVITNVFKEKNSRLERGLKKDF